MTVGKSALYRETRPRSWKRLARDVYGDQCAVCDFSVVTDIHHIVPRAAGGGNEVENLIVLCPNHHRMAHAGLLSAKELAKAAAKRRK